MKNQLSNIVMACALVVGFAAASAAQQPRETAPQSVNTVDEDRDDGMDMGWLGLFGLAGLLGLKRRESRTVTPVVRTDSGHSATAR